MAVDVAPPTASENKAVAAVRGIPSFYQAVLAEMKKVTWPTRDELVKATRMIVVLSILLGITIGLMDFVLQAILVNGVARLAR